MYLILTCVTFKTVLKFARLLLGLSQDVSANQNEPRQCYDIALGNRLFPDDFLAFLSFILISICFKVSQIKSKKNVDVKKTF